MNKALWLIVLAISVIFVNEAEAQEAQYKIGCVGFYNFENLFDTEDTPDVRDSEYTPTGERAWTEERYREKLDRLTKVVSEIGIEKTPDGVAILGVSEIENRKVLEDFVAHPTIASRDYQIIQFDSPDKRGIDVALLYQAKYFHPVSTETIPLIIMTKDSTRKYTRDILHVSGVFDGDLIHVFVNHWPSRGGGPASVAWRNAAAYECKKVTDKILEADPNAKIIIMGDLNDDPASPSVKKVIGAKAKKKKVQQKGFFNPMYDYYKKGYGTLAYNDAWNLFDQLIISKGLIDEEVGGYQFYKAKIFKQKYMLQKDGRFKGYPLRTFGGSEYKGGYSDHFPVYLYLVKSL